MADNITVKIEGLDDLRRVLAEIPDKLKKKHLLSALRKAARIPLVAARQVVPVMSSETSARAPYRTPGLLKSRLTVRTSKSARKDGNVGVFMNIKPLKSSAIRGFKRLGMKSSQNPSDPFYWKFINFGTKKMPARDFMSKAADSLPEALDVFKREIAPIIEWWNRRK